MAGFYIGEIKCLKKRTFKVNQKDIYQGAFEKIISQKYDLTIFFSSVLFFFLFIQFLELFCLIFDLIENTLGGKPRNNRLNISNNIFKMLEVLHKINGQMK